MTAERPAKRNVRPLREGLLEPREAAIYVYASWLRKPARIEPMVEKRLASVNWEPRDRGLFFELCYGMIRQHERLRWQIARMALHETPTDKLAYAAIAAGLYQLLFLDRIPDYAVVDGSVAIAHRAGGEGPAGLVNAILRRCIREREEWRHPLPYPRNPLRQLSVIHSHPLWMIERWDTWMGREALTRFLEWNNRRPHIWLRVDRRLTSAEYEVTELERAGVRVSKSTLDHHYLEAEGGPAVRDLPPIRDGRAVIQDISQSIAANLADPKAGETALDLCAAPGGKAGQLAEICPDCSIVATDSSPDRLERVIELRQTHNYDNLTVANYGDVMSSKDQYDIVMVDAPCTGTGVLARRPDLRWRLRPDEVRRMAALQLQLLRYAANRVKPGGRIIYSTCSVEPEENGGVIREFMRTAKSFELSDSETGMEGAIRQPDGTFFSAGISIGGDGAFAARIRRRVT